jgi:hypothetical protein
MPIAERYLELLALMQCYSIAKMTLSYTDYYCQQFYECIHDVFYVKWQYNYINIISINYSINMVVAFGM